MCYSGGNLQNLWFKESLLDDNDKCFLISHWTVRNVKTILLVIGAEIAVRDHPSDKTVELCSCNGCSIGKRQKKF